MHKLMEVKKHDNNTKCELYGDDDIDENDDDEEILSGSLIACAASWYEQDTLYIYISFMSYFKIR